MSRRPTLVDQVGWTITPKTNNRAAAWRKRWTICVPFNSTSVENTGLFSGPQCQKKFKKMVDQENFTIDKLCDFAD